MVIVEDWEMNEIFSQTGITYIVAIFWLYLYYSFNLITFCVQLYIQRKKAFLVNCFWYNIFVLFAGASAQ